MFTVSLRGIVMLKKFRGLKLKTMISVLLFVSISVLVIAEMFIRQMTYQKYNLLLYEKNEQMLITYLDYMETMFTRMENLTYSMIGDDFLQKNLTFLRDYPNEDGYYLVQDDVYNRLYNYIYQEEYFDSFLLTTKYRDFVYGKKDLCKLDNFTYYIEEAEKAGGKPLLFPMEGCLLLVREIRRSEQLEFSNLGYIIARIDFTSIMKHIEKTLKHMDADINIALFFDDICVYTNSQCLEQWKNMKNDWCIEGDDFISSYTNEKRGYTMIVSSYYGEIQQTIAQTYWLSFVFFVIVAGMILTISNYFIKQIIKELHFLVYRMDDFGAGILPDERERQYYENMTNEIGKMYRHFYRMTVNYKKLSDDYYKNELLLKDAEFSHMQKQMQPHFMLNSLSIIRWKAHALKDEELKKITDAMASIVKGFMQNGSQMESVENEMQIVENYLYIQQFRFQERLKVEINLSESVLKRKLPRLCIQPLVENSIAYAMDEMISECKIRIFDRVCEEAIEIVVEDNGPGFDEDYFEQLNNGKIQPKGNGTALRNIQERLKNAFSEKSCLYFVRLKEGIQVIIRIPKE